MHISFRRIFFVLATSFAIFAALGFAKIVLIPIGMALLVSFILLPVCKELERWGLNRTLAGFLAVFMLLIILSGAITLFSSQIINLSKEVSNLGQKFMSSFTDVLVFINNNINFVDDLNRDDLIERAKEWMNEYGAAIVNSVATIIGGLISTLIFAFLFLIYRVGLTKAFMRFSAKDKRGRTFDMLKKVQKVGQGYLSGMFILILIMGTSHSIALLIIGIESPFLFGYFVGFLVIIPYVGTVAGAMIPILYTFMTTDSLLTPLIVVIYFWFIQTVESNFLSPKIVGSSMHVNALAAIISLIVGGAVWGVAGMILFMPFVAMLKVVCDEFEELKPIGLLISSDVSGAGDGSAGRTSLLKRKVKEWFSSKGNRE
ncbi:AI-2E family transporter [Marivirga sp. S37H4]|uniref:AI-2E family transporter n=1 Tax=Marivirga aurantiaca TaxID=2802615 RepID=A0A934X0B6_9BACT|nr:AI-2E family transporter [Marivirga aurantiaca]MBK6266314.1 AI-2E family transporter [Marivirga aurantiaca]